LTPIIYQTRLITCDVRFQDGVTWLLNPPDESLPFILADSGFDVWLVGGRGSKYSSHLSLTPNDLVVILMNSSSLPSEIPHIKIRDIGEFLIKIEQ
jgi:hypothetical protein